MEFFTKGNGVKLRSHLDKYLVADDDQETVRQSRNGTSRRAVWTVETVEDKPNLIRLRNCHGKYLTASDTPFLLGMTGEKVTQTASSSKTMDWQNQWEPIRDGFQVKLKSWCGKWLRANGGTPPWRNSVTHDEPHTSKTKNWVIWDVLVVDGVPETVSFGNELSSFSSFGSPVSPHIDGSDPGSPVSVGSDKISSTPRWTPKPKSNLSQTAEVSAMEIFRRAKAVRLRSVHDKYLTADEDEETVTQDGNGSAKNARWTVEPVHDSLHVIRLRSCYGKYLTASNERFLLGATGRKVVQSKPSRLDSSVEWEPIGVGSRVKLRTSHGNYLRANGGVPPWRNSITHNTPHRTATQEWILWDVDVVEILVDPKFTTASPAPAPRLKPPQAPSSPPESWSSSPSSASAKSDRFYGQEWNSDHTTAKSPPKSEGRTIYYDMADEMGEVEEESSAIGHAFSFRGNDVEQLTQELREETGLDDIIVCTRSPLNGKLFPLRLQLPPNNATMRVVLLPSTSRLARDFAI